jgi:hypothetical protein
VWREVTTASPTLCCEMRAFLVPAALAVSLHVCVLCVCVCVGLSYADLTDVILEEHVRVHGVQTAVVN